MANGSINLLIDFVADLFLILTFNNGNILEKMFSIDPRFNHSGGTSFSIKILEGSKVLFSFSLSIP